MAQYLKNKGSDISEIDGSMPLEEFVLLPQIAELEADVIFMDSWQAQEYYRHEGEVAKWQRQT